MASNDVCILFPGIGYTNEKPLMYYAAKLALKHSFEVIRVNYGEMPQKVRGDAQAMKCAFRIAYNAAEKQLAEVQWNGKTVFIGKSIGTAVAAAYAKDHTLKVRGIWYTPISETFEYITGEGIAFHGTNDPWAEDSVVETGCRATGLKLYQYENTNHSLESGDPAKDIQILTDVMRITENYLEDAAK